MNLVYIAVLMPVIGALIGWLTNRMAIHMLFRPRQPWRLLGLQFQGLIPRRQPEIAIKVAQIVERELFNQHLIRHEIESIDLDPHLDALARKLVRERLARKVRDIPLIGSFIDDKLLASLEKMAAEALRDETQPLLAKVASEVEQRIAVERIVEERIHALDLDQLERLIRDLASREFRAIEALGALIGGLIGAVQALAVIALQ